MPIPTSTRYDRIGSPPSMINTPSRSSYLRNPSSTSYSPTVTGNGQQKLNLVTRIAIEGKARKGQDGASIKMFLKICVPLDSVTPGSTVPLFAEQNVKIHSSQVHPLDSNSVPYNFSSTVSPLLNNAARALNLSARSQDNFASVFNLPQFNGTKSSSRSINLENSESIPPIDVQYTGHIIVSGYNISFVLPKVFLTRRKDGSDNEHDSVSRTPAAANRRRLSIGERSQAQFMAAIDMWIPFASVPPRAPYLLSIPTPRCLHNHIKLRIFPPANTATSFASLSSIEEDNTSWDLTAEPHVTRTSSSRSSRKHAYTHFADDESSDSSIIGISEGCVLQGTFPSAENIRVRWAKPMKNLNIHGEESGRRRVGVEDVKGEMTCVIRGKGTSSSNPETDGVLMDVEYKGRCHGIWFPGVATLLGLDVGLEAKGSDICWPAGYPTQWQVSGGTGYTGFDNGSSVEPSRLNSRTSSTDSNSPALQVPSNTMEDSIPPLNSRVNSTSSLLRAPLPAQNVAEYSFEGSNATLPSSSGTLSSVSSLPTSSTPILPPVAQIRPPGSPITLHVNVNELQPAPKHSLEFNVTGTVLVTARATLSRINGLNSSNSSNGDKRSDPDPIVLPRFTVLAADSETTYIAVRNEVESALVEVFHPTGDIHNDPQTRKTVLQKNGFTRCGEDGGRIALKFLDAFNMTTNGHTRPATRPRTPSNAMVNRISSPLPRTSLPARSKRDGPPIIPSMNATVTALAPDADMLPTGYAVRVCLQTPALADSEWLEFGMAHGSDDTQSFASAKARAHRKVHIICATLDGVPVKSEITKASKTELGATTRGASFEELAAREWIYWGKVFAGGHPGSSMVIDYIVKEENLKPTKGKQKRSEPVEINILLPTFFVSIARLEVKIDVMPSLEISSLRSNFDYHHVYPDGNRLLRYSLEEYSQSQLILSIQKATTNPSNLFTQLNRYIILTWILFSMALYSLYHLLLDTSHGRGVADADGYGILLDSWTDLPTVTVTSTVYGKGALHEWFADSSSTPSSVYSGPKIATTTPFITAFPASTIEPSQSTTYQDVNPKESSVSNPPSSSILQEFGLMTIGNLLSFNWSTGNAETIKRALDKVMGTMEVVWNICRRVYHYPLDPP